MSVAQELYSPIKIYFSHSSLSCLYLLRLAVTISSRLFRSNLFNTTSSPHSSLSLPIRMSKLSRDFWMISFLKNTHETFYFFILSLLIVLTCVVIRMLYYPVNIILFGKKRLAATKWISCVFICKRQGSLDSVESSFCQPIYCIFFLQELRKMFQDPDLVCWGTLSVPAQSFRSYLYHHLL